MYAIRAMKRRTIAYRNKEVRNVGLVKEIVNLIRKSKGTVVIEKVRSHDKTKCFSTSRGFVYRVAANDMADEVAKEGARGPWTDEERQADQP